MNKDLQFPPLTYSKWTQWLLKDTTSDCIIHHQKNVKKKRIDPSDGIDKKNNMELIQLLAIQSLEFTAPVYSFLNKCGEEEASTSSSSNSKTELIKKTSTELKLEREFIQLSGHKGSFAPAGPKSLWKKMPGDSPQESLIYTHLKSLGPNDPFTSLIPHFISQTSYNGADFIELEDLVTRFDIKSVNIMDIKLGTRTFLEDEVRGNSKPRGDLFEKMYKLDRESFTGEEMDIKGVTKLRYMLFREQLSSTSTLGFRIEGIKLSSSSSPITSTNYARLKSEPEIKSILTQFSSNFKDKLLSQLLSLRESLERSDFFHTHEMIGSSLLLIHDFNNCGVWLIDFAKTFAVGEGKRLSHRDEWVLGNREDGVLVGVDNLIRLMG